MKPLASPSSLPSFFLRAGVKGGLIPPPSRGVLRESESGEEERRGDPRKRNSGELDEEGRGGKWELRRFVCVRRAEAAKPLTMSRVLHPCRHPADPLDSVICQPASDTRDRAWTENPASRIRVTV